MVWKTGGRSGFALYQTGRGDPVCLFLNRADVAEIVYG